MYLCCRPAQASDPVSTADQRWLAQNPSRLSLALMAPHIAGHRRHRELWETTLICRQSMAAQCLPAAVHLLCQDLGLRHAGWLHMSHPSRQPARVQWTSCTESSMGCRQAGCAVAELAQAQDCDESGDSGAPDVQT